MTPKLDNDEQKLLHRTTIKSGWMNTEHALLVNVRIVKHLARHTHSANIVSVSSAGDKCMHKTWINWRKWERKSTWILFSAYTMVFEMFYRCNVRSTICIFLYALFSLSLSSSFFLSLYFYELYSCSQSVFFFSPYFAPIFNWANWIFFCHRKLYIIFWISKRSLQKTKREREREKCCQRKKSNR